MKDSDLRRPSSEFRAPLGAEGSHLAWIELPEPAGKRRETKGSGAEEAAKGPSAPRSPDKAAPGERRFSPQSVEGRKPGPATRAAAPWGPDTRPHSPAPRPSTAPQQGGAGGASCLAGSPPAAVPTRSWAPLAPAPLGPLLSRPGRRAARNKGAAAAPPAAPARALLTAYPSPGSGPGSPSPLPGSARRPPAAPRRQARRGPGLGCAAGPPRGRTHRCNTRTTGSRWGTWLSPERCRRWS